MVFIKYKGVEPDRLATIDRSEFMDFKIFTALCSKAYRNINSSDYTLDEVLQVFKWYFTAYEHFYGYTHPFINVGNIERIILKMPVLESDVHGCIDVDADDYQHLIEAYFNTDFPHSDRNVNHFFSGDIRTLRYYEILYYF